MTTPIKLYKDPAIPGVFRAKMGKRAVLICLSKLDTSLGLQPTDDDCRRAFNESRPGDAIAGPLTPVWRMFCP